MNEVFRAPAALRAACGTEGWKFCFIGGLAVHAFGGLPFDCEYVVAQLAPLAELKESPDILRRLADRRSHCER